MDSKIWKKSAILIRVDFLPKEWINFKKVNVQFFPKVLLNGSLNIVDEKAKLMP